MSERILCKTCYTYCISAELIKICPLGTDVGGFLWQCPRCKMVTSDWEDMDTSEIVCESCTVKDCHSSRKNYTYCGAYKK
jgi:hypothetical protein